MGSMLEQAFGARLLEGRDEWRGVDEVLRTALHLLYRELRRQARQLASLASASSPTTMPPQLRPWPMAFGELHEAHERRWAHASDEMALMGEQIRVLSQQVALLNGWGATTTKKPPIRRERPTGIETRDQSITRMDQLCKLRSLKCARQLKGLERELRVARKLQRQCEDLVVLSIEKNREQLQHLRGHIQANTRRCQVMERRIHGHSGMSPGRGIDNVIKNAHAVDVEAEQVGRDESTCLSNYSHHKIPSRSTSERSQTTSPPVRRALSHMNLRRRYQRERKRQIRCLEELRRPRPHQNVLINC